jgi:hypothetical protein
MRKSALDIAEEYTAATRCGLVAIWIVGAAILAIWHAVTIAVAPLRICATPTAGSSAHGYTNITDWHCHAASQETESACSSQRQN